MLFQLCVSIDDLLLWMSLFQYFVEIRPREIVFSNFMVLRNHGKLSKMAAILKRYLQLFPQICMIWHTLLMVQFYLKISLWKQFSEVGSVPLRHQRVGNSLHDTMYTIQKVACIAFLGMEVVLLRGRGR